MCRKSIPHPDGTWVIGIFVAINCGGWHEIGTCHLASCYPLIFNEMVKGYVDQVLFGLEEDVQLDGRPSLLKRFPF